MASGSDQNPAVFVAIALGMLLLSALTMFWGIKGSRFQWINASDKPIGPASRAGAFAFAAFSASSALLCLTALVKAQWMQFAAMMLVCVSFLVMMKHVRRDTRKKK
jgi:hypothetical protein